MRDRINHWLDSDLVGIPATIYTFGVLAVSLAVFRFGGPMAGIIVAVALWIPMVVFAIHGVGRERAPLDIEVADEDGSHRVLVVANQGLDDPALCAEVCRRADHAATEAMILAPVFTPAKLNALADDVDEDDVRPAERRVDETIRALEGHGVKAVGHVTVTEPLQATIDGLREFPANEVVLLPGGETGWEDTDALVGRIRAEVGLPVTVVDADRPQPLPTPDQAPVSAPRSLG
ncbi:MAG: hypothetical protein JSS68_14075 [Actinobacteria bacterium]|nr:hypothetical protein [Actinomycetota bacterium]MBS1884648.1 hypothetical protein [Actinomycetota bacterium]